MDYKQYIRVIPDFPQPGIRFKDITTLLKDGPAYRSAIQDLAAFAREVDAEVIAGPEARGFVVGAPLSYEMSIGFVPIRKSGKLPYESIKAEYDLEYGKDALAVHVDAIQPGQRVLIADDLLATGGTIESTIKLVEQLGGKVVGAAFFIELSYLDGRKKIGDIPVKSLVQY
ncbi:adenine phosphoribosyltransferase [Brevibacillus centrosporus]|jgi:adenine phosphoribosyltransferase|uniref:adenine phosphoribosyltransferase n=1 Tax=Brevibacillus centrosporus TaxID=54910 RepID=UPI002E1B86B9|nr:adenine phosphoribosyltransferase [Brevibacillus centrosporus]MDF2684298.1 adenine phosphoribosyltransferase [Brevibacillus sp.]MED1952518.1 adenine phosphoribosyltransferase [Brevibacillus centrosporus]